MEAVHRHGRDDGPPVVRGKRHLHRPGPVDLHRGCRWTRTPSRRAPRRRSGSSAKGVMESACTVRGPAEFKPVNDVLVDGRKISGSAQVRRHGVVLQHGTLLVRNDYERMFAVLRSSKRPREEMTSWPRSWRKRRRWRASYGRDGRRVRPSPRRRDVGRRADRARADDRRRAGPHPVWAGRSTPFVTERRC